MLTDDEPDSRLHEERLAVLWANAHVDGSLPVVLDALRAHDIYARIEIVADVIDVTIQRSIADGVYETFDSAYGVAGWLLKTAEDLYPALRTSRLMKARASV